MAGEIKEGKSSPLGATLKNVGSLREKIRIAEG